MDGDTNRDMSIEEIMLADEGAAAGAETSAAADRTDGGKTADKAAEGEQHDEEKAEAGEKTQNGLLNEKAPESAPQSGADAKPQGDAKPEGSAEPPAEKGAAPAEPTVEVEFLGKRRTLTIAEAKAAAQKGLNYDHIKSQLDELKNSPALRLIGQYAADNGLTPEEYVRRAQELREEQADAGELQQLVAAGNKPEVARELLRLRREAARKSEEQRRADQERQDAEERGRADQERRSADFAAFVAAYPDVKTLPDEVAQAVAGGESPLTAYTRYENARLREQLKAAQETQAAEKKKEENRKKNPGSMGSGRSEEAPDPLDEALKRYGWK